MAAGGGVGRYVYATRDEVIEAAIKFLESRMFGKRKKINSVGQMTRHAKLTFSRKRNEEFGAYWLDSRNRILGYDTIGVGSVDRCVVYTRRIVEAAMERNAAGVVFAHNHPSGDSEPSRQDKELTDRVKKSDGRVGRARAGPFGRGGGRRDGVVRGAGTFTEGGRLVRGLKFTEDEVRSVRDKAAKLLKKGWCQGNTAQNAEGQAVAYDEPSAVAWCMFGAVAKAVTKVKKGAFSVQAWAAAHELCDAMLGARSPVFNGSAAANFNDALRTTKQDVIRVVKGE